MYGYLQRVENGLLYIVSSSDMNGDEQKWLNGIVRCSDTAGFELRKAICMYEVAQIYNGYELRMNGWAQ
jgi:hypothetical protein